MSRREPEPTYAVVDIETTGGNATHSRITEIAVLIHNGREVIERYETLVNPEKDIPLPIFALTGINNEMVRHAPVFADIAERVFELLNGRVFVAHNVNFDYSFVRHQLEEAGYKWTARKLCTVRMSRKIKPGLRSYSLGHLCNALGIEIQNRHRAGGDADATAVLLSKLLAWDMEGVAAEMLKRTSKDQRLPPNLPPEDFDALPPCPGVYYFRDRAGKVIYVGKAVNLKKRVATHFTGHTISPQRQHFLREICAISFEICATELMALLLECIEIKRLWPAYNRALKRFEAQFGLLLYEDQTGYKRLAVGKLRKLQPCLQAFYLPMDAVRQLNMLIEDFRLAPELCYFGFETAEKPAGNNRSAESLPPPDTYNIRVEEAIHHLSENRPSFAIMDKGRDSGERSCIWVEQGHLYAMGYISDTTDLNTPEDIRDSLTRYSGNHYMMQLIESYAGKYPGKVRRFSPGQWEVVWQGRNEIIRKGAIGSTGLRSKEKADLEDRL